MGDHYFSAEPGAASRPRAIAAQLGGRTVEVTTDSGVFSPGRVDLGTQVLLRHLPPPPPGNLLDLGCGWGPLSLHAGLVAAAEGTGTRVWALDVNARSLALTEDNARALGIHSIRPVTAAEVPADLEFAAIWSNPPIRIGKDELHALLLAWLPRLAPGGQAWLVVSKNLGADSLQAWLAEQLGAEYGVERRASAKGFRVLVITRAVRAG
ncbi:methyltransferase [Brevibacterium sp. 5221]|uniref:Methyltransferase n=1 Tax=Brevibacterium rongguiense TaxID=2695267 RepID=A0A6N9H7D3_9MICO|nr:MULTISPECIES: methyltransferase [Brevibacterium]MYM19484.1 methyltransferase [Brevibacterium rongguiense]WAL41211.1 methyltransferase [Brevibacterium sp. BRM-1]